MTADTRRQIISNAATIGSRERSRVSVKLQSSPPGALVASRNKTKQKRRGKYEVMVFCGAKY